MIYDTKMHIIKKIKVVDKTKGQIMPSNNSASRQGTMTAVEYKTEFSMWAISASPLVVTV